MRPLARRLAVGALSAALALGAAEAAWRVRAGRFGPTTNPRYVVRDDELGWRYLPGARVRHRTQDFDVQVEIDARGLRDASPAPAGSRPIAALGDSLTFGWGVEEAQAFPALLERLTGVPVENLGVSGYGTDQELLFFRRAGAALAPRALVVTVCGNDVEEVARRSTYGRAKPWFRPGGPPLASEPPAAEGFFVRWSQLARSLHKALAERAARPLSPPEVDEARAEVVALLAELGRLAAEGQGGLLVCAAGEPWLAGPLSERGIAFLDLGPALERAGRAAPVTFAHDLHWTAQGHAAVAAAVAERLGELGLLD